MPTEEEVRESLRQVVDPEFDVNIVDLGLVHRIEVEDGVAEILMTLTSRSCPFREVFDELITEEVEKIEDLESVDVELTFDPGWDPNDMSEEARREIGHIPGTNVF